MKQDLQTSRFSIETHQSLAQKLSLKKTGWHFRIGLLWFAAFLVIAILIWQAIAAAGAPDPTAAHISQLGAGLDIGVLVFREGLECILVLASIMASMTGPQAVYRRPVVTGAGIAFGATLITWFVVVRIVQDLTNNFSALDVQAATGLLAVVVLLIIMNWFFHKVYWGGWISLHNRKKKELLQSARGKSKLWLGMGVLGFASLYREGFEVVLFLQSYYLKLGGRTVAAGASLGLLLTAIVAVLTFVAHRRLPHRKMLVVTGALLGIVLLVMVGEQAQEMQLAHWIPTTEIYALSGAISPWMGTWFSIFPTVQSLAAQFVAALFVAGSYYAARKTSTGPVLSRKV